MDKGVVLNKGVCEGSEEQEACEGLRTSNKQNRNKLVNTKDKLRDARWERSGRREAGWKR